MRRRTLWWLAGCFAIMVGCSDPVRDRFQATEAPTSTSSTIPRADADGSASEAGGGIGEVVPDDSLGATDLQPIGDRPSAAIFTVSGGALPADVIDAYLSHRGQLLTPVQMEAAFGPMTGLAVNDLGAMVTDVAVSESELDDAAARIEEVTYLLMDQRSVTAMLDTAAAGISPEGWGTTSPAGGSGTRCERRTTSLAHWDWIEVWVLSACSYDAPHLDGLIAFTVRHQGVYGGPVVVPPVAADSDAVASALLATVTAVEVRFQRPDAVGLTLTVAITSRHATNDPRAVLDPLLQGWLMTPGLTQVVYSAPPESYTATSTTLVYRRAGLVPV